MTNQYTVSDDAPWKDEDTLREAYYDDRTTSEIADEWGCAPGTIYRWVDKFDLERREKYGGPWTDRETLIEMYWGERMSQSEMADKLGCNQATLSDWFNRHGIPTRYTEKKFGKTTTTEGGYVYFAGGGDIVWVHQLLAIADGEDPGDVFGGGTNIHHRNEVPWDNRSENVELLTVAEHTEEHREDLIAARRDN